MKTFVYALTALTLATGTASAGFGTISERQDLVPAAEQVQSAARTEQVPARTVMTSVELSRAGLSGDDLVTVTKVGTDAQIANLYRDR